MGDYGYHKHTISVQQGLQQCGQYTQKLICYNAPYYTGTPVMQNLEPL